MRSEQGASTTRLSGRQRKHWHAGEEHKFYRYCLHAPRNQGRRITRLLEFVTPTVAPLDPARSITLSVVNWSKPDLV